MYHLIEYCFVWHGATADCPEACLAERVLALARQNFYVAGIGNFGEHPLCWTRLLTLVSAESG